MSSPAVQQYLDALITKAIDETAERIEFIPGAHNGLVRYFERPDTCYCLELPVLLHRELVQHIIHLAHLTLTHDNHRYESWLRVATDAREKRVHVTARSGPGGATLKLHF
jgi:hypothetical protein